MKAFMQLERLSKWPAEVEKPAETYVCIGVSGCMARGGRRDLCETI